MTRLAPFVILAMGAAVLPSAAQEAKKGTAVFEGLRGVPVGSTFSLPAPTLILSATESAKEARIRFGVEHHDLLLDFQLTTPIDQPDTVAQPLSLDGLADGAALGFSLGYLRWRAKPNVAELQRMCREAVGKPECDDVDIPDAKRAEWDRHFHYSRTAAVFSATGRVSHKEFRWLDPAAAFSARDAQHTDYSIGGMAGLFNPSIGFVAAHFDRQTFHRAAGATQLCRPLGTTGASTCSASILRGPAEGKTSLLHLELRKFLGNGNFAVNPVFTRDFENDVSSLEVPLYFLRDDQGGLTGGVSLGWRSDQDAFVASVFVGPSLPLITRP